MLILFDNNVPRGLGRALAGHTVTEARERNWVGPRCKMALVILTQGRWGLVRQRLPAIATEVDGAKPGSYIEVDIPIR